MYVMTRVKVFVLWEILVNIYIAKSDAMKGKMC